MQSEYEELLSKLEEAKDIAAELWERWEPDDLEDSDRELIKRYKDMQ